MTNSSDLPAVHLAAVTKGFGPVQVVRGIDLELHQGEVVAFLGPNGAGKTASRRPHWSVSALSRPGC